MAVKYTNKNNINLFNNDLAKEYYEHQLQNDLEENLKSLAELTKRQKEIENTTKNKDLSKSKEYKKILNKIKNIETLTTVSKYKLALGTQEEKAKILNSETTKKYISALSGKVGNGFAKKHNDKSLNTVIEALNYNSFYKNIINKQGLSNFLFDYTDYGGVNISTSYAGMQFINNKLEKFKTTKKGFLHVIDTETLGATNETGVWMPSYITEFAKVTTDLSTGKKTSTNILMTNPEVYTQEYERVMKALTSGSIGEQALLNDESLRVSMERFALYGSDKTVIGKNDKKGYYFVEKIASLEDIGNKPNNIDLITKGYNKLVQHSARETKVQLGNSKISLKADVKEFIDSLAEIDKSIRNDTSILAGYNIQKFDRKTINSMMTNLVRNDNNALQYAKHVFGYDPTNGIFGNKYHENILDLQDFVRAYTNIHGNESLIGKEIFKNIHGKNPNRQEYLAEALYPSMMKNAAHAALADTEVLSAMLMQNMDGKGETLLQHLMGGLTDKSYNSVRLNSNNGLFIANKGTAFTNNRNVLDFVTDKNNNIFFSSGHSIINGNLSHSSINLSPSNGIRKNGLYTIADAFTVDSGAFINGLGGVLPEYSSGNFNVLKLKAYRGKYEDTSAEQFIYKVFDTREDLVGFINSNFSHVGSFDAKGNFVIDQANNMEDRLQTAWAIKNKKGVYSVNRKSWNQLTDIQKIQNYVNRREKDIINNKGANYLFGNKRAKRTAQLLDFINAMNDGNYGDLLSNSTQFSKFYNTGGKHNVKINKRTYTEKDFEQIKKLMYTHLGYKDKITGQQVLLGSTANNAIAAMAHVDKLSPYYTNVFNIMASNNNINEKSYVDIYNQLSGKGIAVNETFSSLNEDIFGSTALKYFKGDYEKAIRAANFNGLHHDSVQNLKNIYDFKMGQGFFLQQHANKTKGFNILSSNDIITVDVSKSNPTGSLINSITKKYLDSKEVSDATLYKYQREAFSRFITEIDNNRRDYRDLFNIDAFSDMVSEVMENPDFDLEDSSRIVINSIIQSKKDGKNMAAGIRKNNYSRTTSINKGLADALNSLELNDIDSLYSKHIYEYMHKSKKADFVDSVINNYMFNADMIDNYKFRTPEDKKRAQRLYNNFKSKLRTTAEDIWDASVVSGSKLAIDSNTGDIFISRGDKSISLTEVPELAMDNGMLYIRTRSGTNLQYHESFVINENGELELRTNLDGGGFDGKRGHFGEKGIITNRTKQGLDDGTFDLLDINRKMVRNTSDYRNSSAYLNFSAKDYILGNSKIDTAEADRLYSLMFGEDATEKGKAIWRRLVTENKLNTTNFEKYVQSLHELNKGELAPNIRTMAIADVNTLLDAFVNDSSPDAPTLRELIRFTAATGKDTDTAKGILQTNSNNIANFFNLFDNQGRPTVISQLNAKYLRTNTIEGTKHFYENFLIDGGIFQSEDLFNNIRMSMNTGLKRVGIQTDFTHSAAYLGTIGLENTFANEMDRVINNFKINDNLNVTNKAQKVKDLYSKIYNQYVGSVFEQSRVLDSRMIEGIYGAIPQDIQRMSGIKNIEDALDIIQKDALSGKRSNKLQEALSTIGSVEIDDLGNITYKKSHGTIVRRKESAFRTSSYGGSTSPFSSKFDYGILGFNLRTKEGLELTEEEISSLLTKKLQQQLVNKSDEEAGKLIGKIKTEEGLFSFLLSDFGKDITAGFEIKNIRDAELIKAGSVDKGMAYIPLTKVGEIDETLAKFMREIGASSFVGNDAISSEGIAALTSDYVRKNPKAAQKLYKRYGVNNAEELINKMTGLRDIEKHEISRMMFSKSGIFKGEVSAIVNDNILGHNNIGMANASTLSKAVELYGKYYGTGSTIQDKYISSLDSFIDLINNNEEFQFLKKQSFVKDQNGNVKSISTPTKLYRDGTSFTIKEKATSNMDEMYTIDQSALNNLIEHIDKQLEAKNADLSDRLIHKDVYVLNKDGQLEKATVMGNIRTHEAEIDGKTVRVVDGINGNINTKVLNDSEVQSYVTDEYLKANTILNKKKAELREAREKGDTNLIKTLKKEINTLNEITENQSEYSRRMLIDDQFRNILSAHKLDQTVEDDINHMIKNGRINNKFIDAAREFIIQDKDGIRFRDELKSNNVYESLLNHIKGLITYDPTKEEQLTQEMIDKIPEYSMYQDIYDLVTKDMGMQLGVDSAQRIHGLQGAYQAHGYNTLNLDPNIEQRLIDKYGFKSMSMNEFANSFGKVSNQTDSMINQGFILDLGQDFGGRRKIAVPGLGSVSGDNEIREKWQQSLSSLSNAWNEYNRFLGDPNANKDDKKLKFLKGKISDELNNIISETDKIASKDGVLGRMAKIETDAPYVRTKLLSATDSAGIRSLINNEGMVKMTDDNVNSVFSKSFKNKAMINGKTLQEWESGGLKNGVFFNYGSAGINEFRKLGFFDKDYLNAAGMTEREMIEHLEKYGTMQLVDRYPNILEGSVQNVRMFLDRNARTDNGTSLAEWTMLRMNGDSDGDSVSKMLLREKGIDYTLYDINRQRAESTVQRQMKVSGKQLSDAEYAAQVKQQTVKNLKGMKTNDPRKQLSEQDAIDIFDTMEKYKLRSTVDTIDNLDVVAEQVLPTMFKDEAKNYRLSGGVVGANVSEMENIGAQVVGGKSILGKIRLSNLQNAPGAFDKSGGVAYMIENTKRVNALMNDIVANKDELIKTAGINFGEYKNLQTLIDNRIDNRPLNIHGAKIGDDQHKVLDEILSIVEKDSKGKNILNTSYDEAQELIINRIRADIYNQNAIAKSNKGVIGEVNAALYSIRQASSDIYKTTSSNEDSFRDKLIQKLGYELEEHVISSKKKVFEAGDTRLKDLSNYITKAKEPNGVGLSQIKENVSDWIYDYMSESKIGEIYTEAFEKKAGSPVKTPEILNEKIKTYMTSNKFATEEQARAKAQADIISEHYIKAINTLNNSEEGRAAIKMYGTLGRRSGTLSKTSNVDFSALSQDSFASAVTTLMTGSVPQSKPKIPPVQPNVSKPKSSPQVNKKMASDITKEFLEIGKDFVSNASISGIGLGMVGFAAGLMVSSYASGNPLKDPKNDHIENKPEQVNNMDLPTFFDKQSGYATVNQQQQGYIINIKADTRKGQRYAKKAMKQAASASVGGAVNINMNFKSNNSGGYTDKDIENIINNYI